MPMPEQTFKTTTIEPASLKVEFEFLGFFHNKNNNKTEVSRSYVVISVESERGSVSIAARLDSGALALQNHQITFSSAATATATAAAASYNQGDYLPLK